MDGGFAVPAGAPQNFTIHPFGSSATSAKLQWNAPDIKIKQGDSTLYEVVYHLRQDQNKEWSTNISDEFIIFENLLPNSEYIFQIRAHTYKGPGPWSYQLPFKTPPFR